MAAHSQRFVNRPRKALARSERELKQLNSWGEDHPLQGRHRLLGLALLDEAEDRVGGASWPNR